MKKYLTSTALSLLALPTFMVSALACAEGSAEDHFSGTYMGVQIGLSDTKGNLSAKGVNEIAKKEATAEGQNHHDAFASTLLLGYGKVCDDLYWGGELRVGLPESSYTNKTTFEKGANALGDWKSLESKYTHKKKESAMLAGRFGYLMTPKAMMFLSLGLGLEKHQYNFDMKLESSTENLKVNTETNKTHVVVAPGIGAEMVLAPGLNLRADYNIHIVPTYKQTINIGKAEEKKTLEINHKNIRRALMVGLSYKF